MFTIGGRLYCCLKYTSLVTDSNKHCLLVSKAYALFTISAVIVKNTNPSENRTIYNLEFTVFKSIINDLHCKQQHDLPPVVNIGQWKGIAEKFRNYKVLPDDGQK
jgi:hypothetical protein